MATVLLRLKMQLPCSRDVDDNIVKPAAPLRVLENALPVDEV